MASRWVCEHCLSASDIHTTYDGGEIRRFGKARRMQWARALTRSVERKSHNRISGKVLPGGYKLETLLYSSSNTILEVRIL